ncbi:tandem-95 repeat protein [Synechococcus sp. CBW1004]|uniref:beta strand repeat-containing protein n=1 Tax=Synechococcus sp. CBW1004 TaxID=1353136 RepID=UPI0018CD5FC5|nr:tandem-95 repeat protein [Synechococcus sp. CBW1004]QPN63586.1 tandem-95 repeat protein [Synechococcus sp. CBW1004]
MTNSFLAPSADALTGMEASSQETLADQQQKDLAGSVPVNPEPDPAASTENPEGASVVPTDAFEYGSLEADVGEPLAVAATSVVTTALGPDASFDEAGSAGGGVGSPAPTEVEAADGELLFNPSDPVPELAQLGEVVRAATEPTLEPAPSTETSLDSIFTDADDVVRTQEDQEITGNVLANATPDPTGDGALSVTAFTVAGTTYNPGETAVLDGVGSLTISSDGAYTFTPSPNYNGDVPVVTYVVSDGLGATETSTLTITVDPVDDVFSDDDESVTTSEDTPISGNVLDNGTPNPTGDGPLAVTSFTVDGDATSYSAGQSATIAGVGTLTIASDGAYTFSPAANYNGTVPLITYIVSDGVGATDSSTLTITVGPVDDVFSDDDESVTTSEDTPISGNVLDNGTPNPTGDGPLAVTSFTVDGDATSYSAGQSATIAGVGTLTIASDGAYTFSPAANYNGTVPLITYIVSDGVGATDSSTLTITVDPVDDVFSDDDESVTTSEDTPISGNVLDNGTPNPTGDGPLAVTSFTVDGDATSYSAGQSATIAGVGTLTIASDGAYTFSPAANYNGTVPLITYIVSDGVGATDSSTLTITVDPVDDVFSDDDESVTTSEDTPISGNVLDNGTPNPTGDGPLAVTSFTVDGDATSYSAGQSATIAGVGTLTIASDGAYTFSPAANYNGTVPLITYIVSDGVGATDSSTLTITVDPVDDVFSDDDESVTTQEDTPISGNVLDNGTPNPTGDGPLAVTSFTVDGDATSYSAGQSATIAGVGTLTIASDGAYTFSPLANYNGTVPLITYIVSDGVGATDSSTLTITVDPVDDVFSDDDESVTTQEDTPISGNVLDNGTPNPTGDGPLAVTSFTVDGDATSYSAGQSATIAGVGTLTIASDGAYTFSPAANYNGTVPLITYIVSDGVGATDSSTLTITVDPVDDVFSDDDESVTTQEDTPISGNVLDNGTPNPTGDGPLAVTSFTVDGDATSYSAGQSATIAGVGTLTIASDGAYTFSPLANYNGTVPLITYIVSDGVGATDSSTLTITVDPVDDVFSDDDESVTTQEDTPISGNVLDNGTPNPTGDGPLAVTSFTVDGDATSYSAGQSATIAGVGTLTIASDGAYTFSPLANYNGTVPLITYIVSDGVGATDSSTLTITVDPVDDVFSDDDESVTTQEDTPISGNVLDNGTPNPTGDGPLAVTSFTVDGDATSYSAGQSATIAGVGTLTIASDGAYTFSPAANYNGTVPLITYIVSDGVGATDSSTLTITVDPVDDVFSDDDESVTTSEDTPISGNVLDNGTPNPTGDGPLAVTSFTVDGDATSYSAGQSATIAGVGTLTIASDGAYTFSPAANYNGTVPLITYIVSDGVGATDSSTLTITVGPVDDVFSDDDESVTTQEDTPISGNVLDNGTPNPTGDGPLAVTSFTVDGDATSYSAGQSATIAGVGTLTIASDGAYTFSPAANYNGTVPLITYIVSDGVGATDSSTLTITVDPVDDVFSDDDESVTTQEDTPISGNVLDNGTPNPTGDGPLAVTSFTVDGDATSYSAGQSATIAGVGTLTIASDGAYTFSPLANYNGTVPLITYIVSDGVGATDSSTLTITVDPVDDVFSDDDESVTTQEDTPISGNVLDNGTPNPTGDGPLAVTSFTVDGDATSYSAGQSATIAGVGTLTIASDGAYTFSPAANYNGTVPLITYIVSDGVGATDSSTLTITVDPVDDVFSDDDESVTTQEDTPISGNVLDNGTPNPTGDGPLAVTSFTVDGDATSYSAGQSATIAGVGTLTIASDGAYTFSPAANYNGTVPLITYIVSDGVGATDSSTLTITVDPVDDVFSDDDESVTTSEDTPISGNVLDNGTPNPTGDGPLAVTSFTVDGDATSYSAGQSATIAGVGTLTIASDGAYTFSPAANYNGTVPLITYIVSDGVGATDSSTLTITVDPVDDVFSDDDESVTTSEDTPISGNVLDNGTPNPTGDGPLAVTSFTVDGDATSYSAGQSATIAGVGTLTIASDGAYTFSPAANYNGTVPLITYIVSDGVGATDSSTLTITVDPVDDVFSDDDESVTTSEDTPISGNVLDNGTPNPTGDGPLAVTSFTVDGDATSYSAGQSATIAGVGTLTIASDGAYTFSPAANYNGTVPLITYIVSDGVGATDSSTLTITVDPVDDVFSDDDESVTTSEDTPISGNVLDNGTPNPTGDGPLAVTSFTVDGDATSYSAGQSATIAGVGTLTIASDGAYTFSPAANYNGTVPLITYIVSDGVGATDSSTLTITVGPVDDVFSDDDESVTTSEDTPISGNVLDNGTPNPTGDGPLAVTSFTVDGDATSYSAGQSATIAGVGTLTIASDGAYTFSPAANYNGTVPLITYIVSDGVGATDSSTLTITVDPVDDVFSDDDESVTTSEDTPISGNVLDNGTPNPTGDGPLAVTSFTVDGDATSYSAGQSATIAGVGTLTIASDGAYTFSPAANYNGTVPLITYIVSDGVGATDSSTLTITVDPVDDVFSDDDESVTTSEDTPISGNVLDNGTPNPTGDGPLAVTSFTVDGDATSYSAGQSATIAGVGTLTIASDGAYTFSPAANYNGTVPLITYIVSDGVGATDSSTLTITVDPVDDVFSDDDESVTTQEDTPISGNVLDNGTPNPTGDGPLAVTSFTVDGDATSYSAGQSATIAGVGTLTIASDGAYTFSPLANYNGTVPLITYIVSDGVGATDSSTLTITVDPVDDVFSDDDESVTTQEDTPISGNVLDNGTPNPTGDGPLAVTSFTVDGDATSYSAGQSATIAGVGTLTIASDGAYTFSPAANYNGTVPLITYIVSDGVGATDSSTLTITVDPVDDVFSDDDESVTTQEDTPISGNVLDNGTPNPTGDGPLAVTSFTVDGDATSYSAGQSATIAGVGTLTIASDGAYTFSPLANYNGTVPLITYIVSDGVGATDSSTLTITVDPVDDVFSDDDESVTTQEDTPISGNVLDNGTPNPTGDGPLAVTSFTVDGDATSYSAGQSATIAGVGTLTIASDGAYTFSPLANYNGTVPLITYIVSDGVGATDSSTLTITVDPVDDVFSDDDESVTTQEDTPISGNVLDNGTPNPTGDGPLAVTSFTVDGDATSYSAGQSATIAGVGTLTIASDGAYTFSPAANYNGTVPLITYIVSDGVGATDSSTLTITVDPVDDVFSDDDESVTTSEDTPISGNVLDNGTPNPTGDGPLAVTSFTVDGDATSYSAGQSATIAGVGTLTIASDGAYTFSPAANYNGTVPLITYIVSDGVGATDSSTLTITVGPVDDVFSDDDESVTTQEDTPISGNVLDNGTPNPTGDGPLAVTSFTVDGDATSYSAGQSATIAGVGTLTIASDGAYTFSPAANYNGTVPLITYIVSDGVGATDSSTLTITVDPVDDVFSDDDESVTTQEDTPISGNVLDNGTPNPTGDGPLAVTSFTVDGDATSYSAGQSATIAGVGTLTIASDGAYTFSPLANYNGTVPLITYIVSDGVGATDSSTLTITVDPVDDVFSDDDESVTTQEDTPISGNVLDNGTPNPTGDGPLAVTSFTVDGDATSYSAGQSATIAGVGTLTIASDGAYTFSPAANYNGTVPLITYIVSDGVGATDSSTLTITVDPVDDVFSDDDESVTTQEDTPISGNVLDNGTPNPTGDGPLAVTSFTVDGDATSYSAGQSATIAGVGTLTIASDGAYTFSPAANYNGTVPLITYIVSDGVGATDSSTLTITVDPVDDVFSDDDESVTTSEDTPISGNVLDNGTPNPTGDGPLAVTSFTVDGDATSYSAGQSATIAGVGTLTIASDGAYTFSPAANYNGTVPLITYIVSDGVGATDSSTLTITVDPVDDVFSDDDESVTTSEDTPISGNVLDNGTPNPTGDGPLAVTSFTVDGDATSYSAGQSATIAGVGTLTIASDGAYTFSPAANYNGTVPLITYIVSDGVGATDSSTLTITVGPVDDVFSDDDESVTTSEDTPISGNVLDNGTPNPTGDGPLAVTSFTVDGDATSYSAGQSATIAGVGTLTIASDGAYTFSPAANYNGTVPLITYIVSDGVGATDSSTLTITVDPVDDVFSDDDESVTTSEDTPISGNVLDNGTPNPTGDGPLAVTSFTVDGDATSYSAGQSATIAGVGTLTIASDGAYTFSPAANYNGTVPLITYIVSDGVGATDSSTLTITVDPVNKAPSIVIDTDPSTLGSQTGPEQVYESGLVNGSNPDLSTRSASGIFTLSDPDGLDDIKSVTINGTAVLIANLAGASFSGTNGTLTITSYDASTGVANYTYLLTSPATDAAGAETDVFSLNTSDGTAVSSPETLTVEIIDDVPMAIADNENASGVNGAVTERHADEDEGVLFNDQFGADGPNVLGQGVIGVRAAGSDLSSSVTTGVGSQIAGTYGTLKLDADGGWTYTANGSSSEGDQDVFVYSIQDADGDISTTTLTLTLSSQLGLRGGHIDVDTYNDSGKSSKHVHQYDDKYNVSEVDTFAYKDSKFTEIDESPLASGEKYFKLVVVNAHLNPGANLLVNNRIYDVTDYGNSLHVSNEVFTLNATYANGGIELLQTLKILFDDNAITGGGLHGTETGSVKDNDRTPVVGEWRAGALSIWAVEVTSNGSGGFNDPVLQTKINPNDQEIVVGLGGGSSTSYPAWETTVFWHWKGDALYNAYDDAVLSAQWNDAIAGDSDLAGNPYPGFPNPANFDDFPSGGSLVTPPIALDLNNDGAIGFLSSVDSGVSIQVDGVQVGSAWIGPEDGFLVYDHNGDGRVNDVAEIVLTSWGDDPAVSTDMQALAAYFDSNHDGVFDANDSAWQSFGVWQDLNVDGVQQFGEYHDLAHWGIVSIGLDYLDGSSTAIIADSSALSFGQMVITYADGTTGLAEDVAFLVEAVEPDLTPEPLTSDTVVPSEEDSTNTLATEMHGETEGSDVSVADLVAATISAEGADEDPLESSEIQTDLSSADLDQLVVEFASEYGLSSEEHAAIEHGIEATALQEHQDFSLDEPTPADADTGLVAMDHADWLSDDQTMTGLHHHQPDTSPTDECDHNGSSFG